MDAHVAPAVAVVEAALELTFRRVHQWWANRPTAVLIDWDHNSETLTTSLWPPKREMFLQSVPTRELDRVAEAQARFATARDSIEKKYETGLFADPDERLAVLAAVLRAEGLDDALSAQRIDRVEAFGEPEEFRCVARLRRAWAIDDAELKAAMQCDEPAAFPLKVEIVMEEDWDAYEAEIRARVTAFLQRILTIRGRESIIQDARTALIGLKCPGVLVFEQARFYATAERVPFKRQLRKCWAQCGYDDLMFDLCTERDAA